MRKKKMQLADPKEPDPQMTHLQRVRLLSEVKEKTNWTTLRADLARAKSYPIMKVAAQISEETELDAITRTSTRGAGRPRTATTQNALDLKTAGMVRTKHPHVAALLPLSI